MAEKLTVESVRQPLETITAQSAYTEHLLEPSDRIACSFANQRHCQLRRNASSSQIRQHRLTLAGRQIAELRTAVLLQVGFGELGGERLAARAPHRDGFGESLGVVNARYSD